MRTKTYVTVPWRKKSTGTPFFELWGARFTCTNLKYKLTEIFGVVSSISSRIFDKKWAICRCFMWILPKSAKQLENHTCILMRFFFHVQWHELKMLTSGVQLCLNSTEATKIKKYTDGYELHSGFSNFDPAQVVFLRT